MTTKLKLTLSLIAVSAAIAACGGGGGGGGDNNVAQPPTSSTTGQPQLTVPAPTYTNQHHLGAFNKVNEIRAKAGLGLVAQNSKLDQAAQAHADWMIQNQITGHIETEGTPGFYGVNPADRAIKTGYNYFWISEVISYGRYGDQAAGASAAQGLVDVIYHRLSMLEPSAIDMGVGAQVGYYNGTTVMSLGIPSAGAGQPIPAGKIAVVWPTEGSTNIDTAMGSENPNPVPQEPVENLGYPVSVHCPVGGNLDVASFILKDHQGNTVPTVLRDNKNDPHGHFQSKGCAAALVPTSRLQAATTYTAAFNGTANGVVFAKTWSFTTR